jgi:uncharacterized protein DUF4331
MQNEVRDSMTTSMSLAHLVPMGIMLMNEREITMADHLDAPGVKPPNMDARVDICDIYAFSKPGDVSKSVLVLDVNPVAPTYANSFASEAVYELKVDTNGDAAADLHIALHSPQKKIEQNAKSDCPTRQW